jgi:hypothetical protein
MIPASFKLRAEKEALSLGFRRLSLGPGQSWADVASRGNDGGYCFTVRLVVITDDRRRSHAGATQRAPEAGVRPGAVPLVRQ